MGTFWAPLIIGIKKDRLGNLSLTDRGDRIRTCYVDVGLNTKMVDVWGGDIQQGRTNFKFTIPHLIKLRKQLESNEKNYGLCVFDSVKGMLANSGFKYTQNEHAELISNTLEKSLLNL